MTCIRYNGLSVPGFNLRDAPAQPLPKINASTIAMGTDIPFWSRQLSEHALFLAMGLDTPFQAEATRLHQAWETFRQSLGTMPFELQRSRALDMAAELRAFKMKAITSQRKSWNGWLFPLFLEHVVHELDLFVRHLNGELDRKEELESWLSFMAEHAAFAGHLLDPTETEAIGDARKNASAFVNLGKRTCGVGVTDTLLRLSMTQGQALDRYFTGLDLAKTKSVIHPVLAAHVVREGQRFLDTLKALSPS